MAWLGCRTETREAMGARDVDGKVHNVESTKSAYVLAKSGRRPRERRIWVDRDDGTEYVVIYIDRYTTLLPVRRVLDSQGNLAMYEMVF